MTVVALFMKSPDSGTAKRRLRPVLSEEAITRLCEAFAGDLLRKLATLRCDKKVIACAGEISSAFAQRKEISQFSFYVQSGRDLGKRLQNYFHFSFLEGATKSVVIGSDSPTLPPLYLEEAFQMLDRFEVVLGPSEDGGYYLIGMCRFIPELFQRISWGTERVFEETLKRLKPDRVGILNRWYDVDTPTDLKRLQGDLDQMKKRNDPDIPMQTSRLFSEWAARRRASPGFNEKAGTLT